MTSTDDAKWLDELREHLNEHNPPSELAERLTREVRAATAEAGQSARELFGPADEYAEVVAEERIGTDRRSAVDINGRTPGALFHRRVRAVLGLAIGLTIANTVFEGQWVQQVSWRLLYADALVGIVALVLFAAFPALRASGRGRMAWTVATTAVLALIGGVLASQALPIPDATLFELPTVVLIGGLLALATVWSLTPATIMENWFAASPSTGLDDQAWLNRLGTLLRGRHGVSHQSAKYQVLETRQHLKNCGKSAEQEFGPVEVYARVLAESTSTLTRRTRRMILVNTLTSVVAIVIAVFSFGPGLNLAVSGIFLAFAGFLTWYSMLLRKGEVRP